MTELHTENILYLTTMSRDKIKINYNIWLFPKWEKPPPRNKTIMASLMNKQEHKFRIPFVRTEINRLIQLLKAARIKVKTGNFLADIYPDGMAEEKTKMLEQKKIHDEHYTAVILYMETKIRAWQQFINYEKDENILDKLNETMDEWLQKGWHYFGQKHIVEESKNAIDEYNMFKKLLNQIPNKPKKPRRRGGKKHKKNKESVWDEVM